MATKREYLVGLGLAKPGRGRFSQDAIKALDEAAAKGVVFDEPVKAPKATDGDASVRVEASDTDAGAGSGVITTATVGASV